ncbi:uncharacterized protein LOC122506833 [Leptopilina heterotoma]|uniref:uncharacterized protein LOC122506833 n=1 Tax=Leptopilina heterotoma TaxID=63436 RepID=UPI001CA7DE3F|nr:uncharacterized protein LOC122506833 [Leptopilina heterotoma]
MDDKMNRDRSPQLHNLNEQDQSVVSRVLQIERQRAESETNESCAQVQFQSVFQQFRPLLPSNQQQCKVPQQFRPVLPSHRKQYKDIPSRSKKSAVFSSFKPLFPRNQNQYETGASTSKESIHRPEQREFLVENDDTRMSFTTDDEPSTYNIAESCASTSWQHNLGLLDIDSTTGNYSDNSNIEHMDVDSGENNQAPQEDSRQSPIPKKRYKLSEFQEKHIDNAREPQPSTSRQADLSDLKQLKEVEFKIPAEPDIKRKKKKAEENVVSQSKFTIKTGFNETFCPDNDMRQLITDKAKLISRMFVLITIFVNFALRHPTKDYLRNLWSAKGPDYVTITYLFKQKLGKTNKTEILDQLKKQFVQEFIEYMGRPFEKFDCVNLTPTINEMAEQLNVNFKTNLTHHARSRLAKFFEMELFKNEEKSETYEEHRKKQEAKREETKKKRKKKNKKKRSRWKRKKKKGKEASRRMRRVRHERLMKKYPEKIKRDKHIFNLLRNKKRSYRILQRKCFYDATNTTRRNRGKKMSKEEKWKQKGKSKNTSSHQRNDKDNETNPTKINNDKDNETKMYDKLKIIKNLVDELLLENKCENKTLNKMNEENLNFQNIDNPDDCHKFLNFFHRLQLYFAKKKCKSFNIVPVMNCGLKYVTITNSALFELERELKKIKGKTYVVRNPVPVKTEGLSHSEIRKKITAEEELHRNKMTPLKAKSNSLTEDKKKLTNEIKALKRKKNCNEAKKELSNLQVKLRKLNDDLKTINEDEKKVRQDHDEILGKRHENKYKENANRWTRLFNISHLRINEEKMKFSGTIMTDGIGVSVIFNLNQPKKQENFSIPKNPILNEEKLENFHLLKGLDPGLKFCFGGVEREVNGEFDINSDDRHIKIKSSSFRWLTGQNRRREILQKHVPQNYHQQLLEREEFKGKVNNKDPRLIVTTTKFLLREFYDTQPILEKRKVARLKWDKYMSVRRETNLLANYIIGDENKKQLIVVGQPDIPPWLKGHVRMSLRAVVKRLIEKQHKSKNLSVVFVNEHRTTVMCSKCNVRVKIFRNRTTYCSTCKTRWNRDVNAGRNILHLGLVKTGLIEKECLPHWEMFNALTASVD